MRLYARVDVAEKYGADLNLISNMPLILEEKRDIERLQSLQNEKLSPNPN